MVEKILNKYYSKINTVLFNTSDSTLKTREKLKLKDYGVEIGKNTIIELGSMIYPNVKIGESCILATSSVIKSGCEIGDHTIIGTLTNLEGDNKIGSWTTIQAQCHLTMGMTVGNNTFIGPCFVTVNTPKIGDPGSKFGYPNSSHMERKIPHVGNNVQIGGGVELAPGVRVKDDAVIYMNSFIKKDVERGSKIPAGAIYG